MVLDKTLLDALACPKCKGELEYLQDENLLKCHACKLAYAIKDDIPIMLVDQATSFADRGQPGE